MKSNKFFKTTLSAALTLGMVSLASTVMAQPMPKSSGDPQATQTIKMVEHKTDARIKQGHLVVCYGINAAYKNDCKSPGHSCAGQDSKARDPGAFVAVPSGLCKKIAGGSLTAS